MGNEDLGISVVVPVYQAEHTLPELGRQLTEVLESLVTSYEIILVDDGSTDQSWRLICQLQAQNPAIKGYKLSRNFGQHPAIFAGLEKATGNQIVVMDCDLQDVPSEIPKLVEAVERFDISLAQRKDRQDSFARRVTSFFFYGFLSYMTGLKQDASVANFGVYKRKVIQSVLSSHESYKYFPTAIQWSGFKSVKVPVSHANRHAGKSNYNLKRLIRLAMDITLAFSDKPLRLALVVGIFLSLSGMIFAGIIVVQTLTEGTAFPGYTSLIASIWAFSGINTLVISLVGLYVGRTYTETKKRPLYIIDEVRTG